MERDSLFILHILEAISKIEDYTHNLDRESFKSKSNTMVQDAVVRELEIIGEAVKRFSEDLKKENTLLPWREIGDMRNKLIHEYFGVDLDVVWQTVQKDIPALKKAMNLLKESKTA